MMPQWTDIEYEVWSRLSAELTREMRSSTPDTLNYWTAYSAGVNRAFYELNKAKEQKGKKQ